MMTIGYDHQVTAMALPNIGLGITAVGMAMSTAVRTAPTRATIQRRRDQLAITSQSRPTPRNNTPK